MTKLSAYQEDVMMDICSKARFDVSEKRAFECGFKWAIQLARPMQHALEHTDYFEGRRGTYLARYRQEAIEQFKGREEVND